MSVGGKRPGAGRPRGATTIRSREIANRAIQEGITPLEVMLENMRVAFALAKTLEAKLDRTRDPVERLLLSKEIASCRAQAQEAAVDAAPYVHPKLASIQYSEPEPQKVSHRSFDEILASMRQTGFSEEVLAALRADRDDRANYIPNHKLSKPPNGSGNGSH